MHRVLGNPTASAIVDLLLRRGPISPQQLALFLKTSVPNVSQTLYKMRLAETVRYTRLKGRVVYDLKYDREFRDFVRAGMRFVDRSSRRLAQDR